MTQGSVRVDRASPRLLWLTGLLGLVMLAVLLALGTWQVERLAWKEALLASIPVANPKLRRPRVRLTGDVPSAMAPPSGCRFHTRCPHATEICSQQEPEMRLIAGLIDRVLREPAAVKPETIRREVEDLCRKFPLPVS